MLRVVNRHSVPFMLFSLFAFSACDEDAVKAPSLAKVERSSTESNLAQTESKEAADCEANSTNVGCPCSESQRISCGDIYLDLENRSSCLPGIQVCEEGEWSKCRLGFADQDDPTGHQLVESLDAKEFSFQFGSAKGSLTSPPMHGVNIKAAALGAPINCAANPCDPNCRAILDTSDHTLSGDSVVYDGVSALTVDNTTEPVDSSATLSPVDEALLVDAGLMPPGDYLYHELSPSSGATAPDPVLLDAELSFIDIYFLLDTSATMGEALVQLSSELSGSGGIIETVRGQFPNARFGVGHFHGYEQAPYAVGGRVGPDSVSSLLHSLDMTTNENHAVNVVNWLGANGTTFNRNATEGFSVALFSSYYKDPLFPNVGPFLYRGAGADAGAWDDPQNFWVTPRNSLTPATEWVSDYGGSAPPGAALGPCAMLASPSGLAQGSGYPCSAKGAAKIAVLMTDNPAEEGPGGQFAYGRYSTDPVYSATAPIQGSSAWPVAIDADAQGNGVITSAIEIDPNSFSRYKGTFGAGGPAQGSYSAARTRVGSSNQWRGFAEYPGNFPTSARHDCADNDGNNAPEAFYEFSLSDSQFIHFDTYGSETDTVLYVIDNASGARVACSDSAAPLRRDAYVAYDPGSSVPGGMFEMAALDARLQPGDYTLVVDQKSRNDCLNGYTNLQGQCVKSIGSIKTGNAAASNCMKQGSTLVKLANAAENNSISSQAPFKNNPRLIGLKRTEGVWRWPDGTTPGYTNWRSGHPQAGRNCALRQTNGRWRSVSCSSGSQKYKSICEQPSQDGYVGGYFLQVNSMPDSTPIAVPSWTQTMDTLNDEGVRVMGIDVSGMGPIELNGSGEPQFDSCDCGSGGGLCETNTKVNRWTYPHLQEAARATGAVDGTSGSYWESPYVFAMNKKGGPCHAGDPAMGEQIGEAIVDLTEKGRQDVYLEVNDHDDATDFDYPGTPQAQPQLSPLHIDEGPAPALGRPHGLFIDSVTVTAVTNGVNGSADIGPDGTTRCHDDPSTPAVIEGCLPDTKVQFNISFSAPPQLPIFDNEQLFSFQVAAKAGGATLTSKDVLIKVPKRIPGERFFVRDYQLDGHCTTGTDPTYSNFTWVAETQGGSSIQFISTLADSLAELDTNAATPGAGFAMVAQSASHGGWIAGEPALHGNTEVGGADLHEIFSNEPVNPNSEYLRIKMVFTPGTDGVSLPKLMRWKLQFSCQPTE